LQLAYDNDSMLELLEKRANALKDEKFDKANKIEDEMTALKNKNFERLISPFHFYATFHTEKA
jgi:hypothetical protein